MTGEENRYPIEFFFVLPVMLNGHIFFFNVTQAHVAGFIFVPLTLAFHPRQNAVTNIPCSLLQISQLCFQLSNPCPWKKTFSKGLFEGLRAHFQSRPVHFSRKNCSKTQGTECVILILVNIRDVSWHFQSFVEAWERVSQEEVKTLPF